MHTTFASCLISLCIIILPACRMEGVLSTPRQERVFRERYMGKPFYTAIVLHPYRYHDEYLIDLSGKVTEVDYQNMRAPISVPLGKIITIVDVQNKHVIAQIDGHTPRFRILLDTERGTAEDVAKELVLLLSPDPPLRSVRPEVRSFIEQQDLTRGMSRQEIYMSWGQPDKVNSSPGASGFLEEWVYFARRAHVFLENGFLTNWQEY